MRLNGFGFTALDTYARAHTHTNTRLAMYDDCVDDFLM